jgi:hypothetical protein
LGRFSSGRRHLGQPQAGLHRHQHEGVIAPPGPCVQIWSEQQGVDLRAGQERDQGAREALAWNGQHALDLRGVRPRLKRCEAKERMDRGEPQIAAANADAAPLLQGIEERHYQGRIDLLEVQA